MSTTLTVLHYIKLKVSIYFIVTWYRQEEERITCVCVTLEVLVGASAKWEVMSHVGGDERCN